MTTLTQILRPLESVAAQGDLVHDDVAAADVASDGNRRARQWIGLAWSLCLALQIWLISAGTMGYWPEYTTRYNLLARGFCLGQTNLPVPTNVRHLALPDPYDPVANYAFRQKPGVPDSCLYGGKLYLYWGPVPALMLVPIKLLAGPELTIGDQYLCFSFVQGLMLVTAAMLLRVRRLYFPQAPTWLPALGLVVAALTTPLTCVLTRSAVYEVAIVGGQFFLLGGMLLAWKAFSAKCHHRLVLLMTAGTSLALAVGCRVSLAVAVTVVGLFVVGAIIAWHRRSPGTLLRQLACFGLPLVAGAVALGWYNYIRFESWHEFGQRYQLAGANLNSYGSLFGVSNLWPGLWSYSLRPAAVVSHFPWLIPVNGNGLFPSFITIPRHYEHFEPITGLLWAMPFLWLIPACLCRRRTAVADAPAPARNSAFDARCSAFNGSDAALTPALTCGRYSRSTGRGGKELPIGWLIAVLIVAAVCAFAPVLLMIGSSQRYLLDLTPPLVIVAMIGLWRLADRPNPRSARRVLVVGTTLAIVSVALGLLLSIEGYSGHFRFSNPSLFRRLAGVDVKIEPGDASASKPSGPLLTGQGIVDVKR